MKKDHSYFGIVSLNLAMAIWLLLESVIFAQSQPAPSPPPMPAGFASQAEYLGSLTNEIDIVAAYQAGYISRDEASQAISNHVASLPYTNEDSLRKAYDHGLIGKSEAMMLQSLMRNRQSQNLYGRVIDQNGQPVAGVDVIGEVEIMDGLKVGKIEKYKTQTDVQGLFQFVGLTGASLSARVSKLGYTLDNYLVDRIAPIGGQSRPNDRETYIMYKSHGGAPMKHIKIQSSVPCDGTPEHFNLLVSKMNGTVPDVHPSVGDFTITLIRDPLVVQRPHPFNWSVTLSITNGGLLEYTNQPYPYEAPETGYQPVVTMNFPTNRPQWKNEIKQSYYFKCNNGQIYGRMTIDVRADRPQPPTYFTAEVYANPAGSRNLEFDPQKQIR